MASVWFEITEVVQQTAINNVVVPIVFKEKLTTDGQQNM